MRLLALMLLALPVLASAAPPWRDALAKAFPDAPVLSVQPAALPGLQEVELPGRLVYVSDDGRFLMGGDLFDLASNRNLSEVRRAARRAERLAGLAPSVGIRIGPAAARHEVYVFVDLNCGYCQQLHAKLAAFSEQGIALTFLAYPLSPPGSPGYQALEKVWCSEDRSVALAQGFMGALSTARGACETTIGTQRALGEALGVQGTPALFSRSGIALGGYGDAAELRARLEQLAR